MSDDDHDHDHHDEDEGNPEDTKGPMPVDFLEGIVDDMLKQDDKVKQIETHTFVTHTNLEEVVR